MDAEVESELRSILVRLNSRHESELPEQFVELSRDIILPALQEIADRITQSGHQCKIDLDVEPPIADGGQTVRFILDTRYVAGQETLCFRLVPGESLVSIEIPAGGSTVTTRQAPFIQINKEHVQRLAIDFLKQVI